MSYKVVIVGDRSFRVPDVVYEEFEKMTAECAELRKDAERYRWIRTAGAWDSEIGMNKLSDNPSLFDAAVDAVIGEKP